MTQDFKKRYIAARKKLIESDFPKLNPEQLKAVMTTEGPLLLLAGAGSGKTTVLINRIANLVKYGRASDCSEIPDGATEDDIALMESGISDEACRVAAYEPVEPWRIIAITFTNKAAGEIKTRLRAALGDRAEDIWAHTFHSACLRILRRDAERLGYSTSFTIYDDTDSRNVVKRIIKDFNLDEKSYPYRYVLAIISDAKTRLITPQKMLDSLGGVYDIRRKNYALIYAEYAKRLLEADAMDFDDLIINAVLLLRDNEDVRSFYQRKFRYLLIDEYQDTSALQYEFASLLAGDRENICVVGDDDQSIYRFRGADIKNILFFEKKYPNARIIKLEQNYRSTGCILDAANGLIKKNSFRREKKLWTEAGRGEPIVVHETVDENTEAQYVADVILDDFERGEAWSSHAILYRTNAQSNQLEYAFKRRGIPYRVIGGAKFFDRAEIKDMLAYLCVVVNPSDDLRLLRIINTPARGIGQATVETAARIAAQEGKSIFAVISEPQRYPELQRASAKLKSFCELINSLRDSSDVLTADEFYDEVVKSTGYVQALRIKDTPENESKIGNVNELKTNIIAFEKETGGMGIKEFLDEVALYTDLDNLDPDADCVVMMTMHSAKGLEFPTVFIVGAEENIFPSPRSIDTPDELEEERRLCYVAITRAMRKLYICCASHRMLYGRTSNNMPSRFIGEIPNDCITRTGTVSFHDIENRRGARSRYDTGAKILPVITPETARAQKPAYSVGDRIRHSHFGEGVIEKMTPMGGDFLLEIDFEEHGIKRILLRAAERLIQKLN